MVRRRWLRITGLPRYERGLWGSSRVVVCDSLHPTNGSVNPTLTHVPTRSGSPSSW